MAWFILILAGLFEVAWAVGLKHTQGFTRLWPTVLTVGCIVISMGLLGVAVRTLPIGTAYAVWTGIGTIGTAVIGIIVLGESASLPRVLCLCLIVGGILGLKVLGSGEATPSVGASSEHNANNNSQPR